MYTVRTVLEKHTKWTDKVFYHNSHNLAFNISCYDFPFN